MRDANWQHWVTQLPTGGVGVRLVDSPPIATAIDRRQRAGALERVGYVTIEPDRLEASFDRRPWLHRHVALVPTLPLSPQARAWLRDLSLTSPRPHLIVREPAHATIARERVAATSWPAFDVVATGPRMERVRRLLDRGRPGDARTWLKAAAAAALRRADERTFATVIRQTAEDTEGDDLRWLAAMCRHGLRTSSDPICRSVVVSVAARVAILQGDLEGARAFLAGAHIEWVLDESGCPPWLLEVEADVALWMGEWSEAAMAITSMACDRRTLELRAVLAWLRGDETDLEACCARPEVQGSLGASIVQVLAAAARGDVERTRHLVGRLTDCRRGWCRAAAVDALLAVGELSQAHARIRETLDRKFVPALESILFRHLEGRVPLDTEIARSGAHGIKRWNTRRRQMSTWGGIATLLDEVNEADDERAVLQRGCRWVRTHTGTNRVCVIAASSGRAVFSDPDGALPGADDVRAAVRHAGLTIGWVAADRRARDPEELAGCVKALASACAPALRGRLDTERHASAGEALAGELIGQSPAMADLRSAIARAAPTTFPVLVEGESGAGKELVARAIHRLSGRRDRRLAAVNCAALTDELLEAELFGHTRGAFTGAIGARPGLFEDAHQGTLFLDEVAELSPRAQAKLLRVLQEGEVRRVGDNQTRAIDVRIVAATNRPLASGVLAGTFREDLTFRLAVIRIAVPPLRDRLEDLPALAHAFWIRASRHRDVRAWLGPDALAALCRHAWPGNVRELQNVMAGLVIAAPARGRVTARHVAMVLETNGRSAEAAVVPLESARRALDRRLITTALARHGGCRSAAARDLGVSRQGLSKLMTRLGVSATQLPHGLGCGDHRRA